MSSTLQAAKVSADASDVGWGGSSIIAGPVYNTLTCFPTRHAASNLS
jgi:hypothetical protein